MNFHGDQDAFNFGFRENSLEDIPPADFHSNPSEFSAINQIPQRRKSLINFSALGSTSTNNAMNSGMRNENNDFSNANDKMRLIPSRMLSNMGGVQGDDFDQQNQRAENPYENPYKSSPPKDNIGLPPLSTLLGFSDQDSNQSQSPPPSPHVQTQKPQNQPKFFQKEKPFFNDDYSDKTSVTISDSSSGKAIQPTTKQAKKGILKQSKKNQYQDEDISDEQQPEIKVNNQKAKEPPPPPPPELKMDLNSSFDSAFDNFRHYFFNEFKAILRPYSLPIAAPEIDNFTSSLIDEISKSIILPTQTDKNQALIARTNDTVSVLIKEETSQITESMKQKSIRMKSLEEKDLSDLKKLELEIKDLTSHYSKLSVHVLKTLNHERTELFRVNESDKLNQKTLLETKRKLNLKLLELESMKNRQSNEVLHLQRTENNLYSSREELRERLLGSYDMRYNKLRAKILSEIDSLTEYIEDPILETISTKSDEIKSILKFGEASQELNNEKQVIDRYPPQQILIMPQNIPCNKNQNNEENSEEVDEINEFSNLKSIAMKKLEELRMQRQNAFKGIYPKTKGKKKA